MGLPTFSQRQRKDRRRFGKRLKGRARIPNSTGLLRTARHENELKAGSRKGYHGILRVFSDQPHSSKSILLICSAAPAGTVTLARGNPAGRSSPPAAGLPQEPGQGMKPPEGKFGMRLQPASGVRPPGDARG